MSSVSLDKKKARPKIARSTYTTIAAVALLVILLVGGHLIYGKILAPNTMSSLLRNYAYLLILAVGLTFTILTGGIDLSVGAIVAFSSVAGVMLVGAGWNTYLVMVLMVLMGTGFGLISGVLVRYFNVQPFIATLSTMFLARGLASMLSTEPVRIPDGSPMKSLSTEVILYDGPKNMDFKISLNVIIAIVVLIIGFIILHRTRFGRTVYAIGGSENSASLMGLPTGRAKLMVYVISGTLAGLAGLVYASRIGNASNVVGTGWELDAIAATVIGGTLLTGGAGYVLGSAVGVFVLGTLNLLINRDGNVPAAATTIITGAILLIFVLLQRAITVSGNRGGLFKRKSRDVAAGGTPPDASSAALPLSESESAESGSAKVSASPAV